MKPPLRLLAVDPSLRATGLLIADVLDYGKVQPLWGDTLTSEADQSIALRICGLGEAVATHCKAAGVAAGMYVVMEDPEGHTRRNVGEARDPRSAHKLGMATGAVLLELMRYTAPDNVCVVPVSRWYPRAGRHRMPKAAIVAQARTALQPLGRVSEHVCMAFAIATWWSCHVAPEIWAVCSGLLPE